MNIQNISILDLLFSFQPQLSSPQQMCFLLLLDIARNTCLSVCIRTLWWHWRKNSPWAVLNTSPWCWSSSTVSANYCCYMMRRGYSRYTQIHTQTYCIIKCTYCIYSIEEWFNLQKYSKCCICVCLQVVQKKEAHDYRCLFRVCFLHRNLQTLLQEDPTAFEYLYLQVVG